MGQQQSKDELLCEQVSYGNVEGIKALRREGAGLEYVDREGKTPLITACLKPELYNVAKTLIELGANVNAYRPGRFGGTPLHHAAKRGLEKTVKLLLSHGANALVINDDCQTPLEIARAKGCVNVVRTIESHICLFFGWLRELHGPAFLESLAPQLLSRKVWVLVLPCGSRNLQKPFKLELAIYTSQQDAQPRTTVALWKAGMEEPALGQPDPAVIITETSTISRRRRRRRRRRYSPQHIRLLRNSIVCPTETRIKLAPVNARDMQQLQQFCSACKGIPQVMHATFPFNDNPTAVPVTAPPAAEDLELAMAISASIHSAMEEGIALGHTEPTYRPTASTNVHSFSGTIDHSTPPPGAPSLKESCSQWPMPAAGPSSASATTSEGTHAPTSVPSAPSVEDEVLDNDPIHYPSIDSSPIDMCSPAVGNSDTTEGGQKKAGCSSCVICLDAPVEGACVPCGHMAGCMSCLSEVKAKKWGCPICRATIDQIIRVYAV